MGRIYDEIDDRLAAWIAAQALYFVGSAPLADDGHVNVSPKGPIGSLRENGRIVVMLCAFEGPPRIVRLHGTGSVLRPGDDGFDELLEQAAFEDPAIPESRRSIVRVEVTRIADSCGYGVPLMALEGERPHAPLWAEKKLRTNGPSAFDDYSAEKNAVSIDGLPAVEQG